MTYFSYIFWFKILVHCIILHFTWMKCEIIFTLACVLLLKLPAFKKSFVHIAFHKLHVNINRLQCWFRHEEALTYLNNCSFSILNHNKECLLSNCVLQYIVIPNTNGKILLLFMFGNDNTDRNMSGCVYQINMWATVHWTPSGKYCGHYWQSFILFVALS